MSGKRAAKKAFVKQNKVGNPEAMKPSSESASLKPTSCVTWSSRVK